MPRVSHPIYLRVLFLLHAVPPAALLLPRRHIAAAPPAGATLRTLTAEPRGRAEPRFPSASGPLLRGLAAAPQPPAPSERCVLHTVSSVPLRKPRNANAVRAFPSPVPAGPHLWALSPPFLNDQLFGIEREGNQVVTCHRQAVVDLGHVPGPCVRR